MAKIECSFYSSALKKNTRAIIILPSLSAQEYLEEKSNKYLIENSKFQTLYLLHGSYGGYTDWVLNTNIARYAQDKCLAVVMPDGENSGYNTISSSDYKQYIAVELPNYLESVFPFSNKRENRFISGLSMGGYGAAYIALEYPQMFSYCGVLSGCVDFYELLWGELSYAKKMSNSYKKQFEKYAETNINLYSALNDYRKTVENNVKFFFTSGDKDIFISEIMEYADKLIEQGLNVKKQIEPGIHDWLYWDEHIKDVLDWLPLKRKCVDEIE
ncbi:MAG: alpha/beta hydrolase-fold protein [Sphaerochaetaceae bacterium]|nr:alpha/beta hydrolase-fold protein [Sphaerochaetaceae bacterium]